MSKIIVTEFVSLDGVRPPSEFRACHARPRSTKNCGLPLLSINPSLRNLFMKTLTRSLVVPTISASVSWLIFAIITRSRPNHNTAASALGRELDPLIAA
jgi:hypothetical protein